jgi:hypothetical protein
VTKTMKYLSYHPNVSIEKISWKFKKNGYLYKQIERTSKKFIFEARDPVTNKVHFYEVFVNKIVNKFDMKNKIKDWKNFKEAFPKNEEFGKRAWAFTCYKNAIDKYHSIGE